MYQVCKVDLSVLLLTSNSLTYFLLHEGLINFDSVVDGDLVITESSSRNHNFQVIQKRSPGFFVKQPKQWDTRATTLLHREASCYWLAANEPGFVSLASHIPTCKHYDPRHYILILELLPDGEDLKQYHRRLGAFPLAIADPIGAAIGAYHRDITVNAVDHANTALFPRTVPWILSAHRQHHAPVQPEGGANQQILSIIHQYVEFHKHLDALHEAWQFDTFIHGDMKWENCIVYPLNGEPQVKIVDWETADFGDACWDVGAIFQAYLTFWIMSMPIQGKAPSFEHVSRAPFPLEVMQPAIRTFWQAYVRTRELAETEQATILQRSMSYGAARMLQTAFEYMHYSPQITVNALSLLQVSLNILNDPGGAVQDLLDL
jgi:hypothetical protein